MYFYADSFDSVTKINTVNKSFFEIAFSSNVKL